MFNGSAGPLLRPTTALDWAGDPFDASRFKLEHGERNFEEFLAHFQEYTDTVCDSPLNLQSTTLALNAYLLTGEKRWRDWLLSYVDAWVERAAANDDILPSKVGLDGRIGGTSGKWYEGVYGWAFSPVVPQTGKREDRNRVPRSIVAFMNAALLTGDDRYMDVWRRQNAAINRAGEGDRRQVADAAHVRPERLVQLRAGPVSIEWLRDLVPVDEPRRSRARRRASVGRLSSKAATPAIR